MSRTASDIGPRITKAELATELLTEYKSLYDETKVQDKTIYVNPEMVKRFLLSYENLEKDPTNIDYLSIFTLNSALYPHLFRNKLHEYVTARHSSWYKWLQLTDVDFNKDLQMDGYRHTILEEICTGSHDSNLIETALLRGCNPNLQSSSRFGNTPLVWAIANNSKETAQLLILLSEELYDAGQITTKINLDQPSYYRFNNPLILSIAKGHNRTGEMPNFEMTKFLLEHGANPNKPDKYGNTPLHIACMRKDLVTVNLLLEHDANPTLTNTEGKTCIDMLDMRYPTSLAELQKTAGVNLTTDPWDCQHCVSLDIKAFRHSQIDSIKSTLLTAIEAHKDILYPTYLCDGVINPEEHPTIAKLNAALAKAQLAASSDSTIAWKVNTLLLAQECIKQSDMVPDDLFIIMNQAILFGYDDKETGKDFRTSLRQIPKDEKSNFIEKEFFLDDLVAASDEVASVYDIAAVGGSGGSSAGEDDGGADDPALTSEVALSGTDGMEAGTDELG